MIGLMADSHDNLTKIKSAVEIFNQEKCSLVIHAGDFVAPFAAKELKNLQCPVKAVYGNCDGERFGLKKAFNGIGELQDSPFSFNYNNFNFLVLHIPHLLDTYVDSGEYNIIVYAHTHKPEAEKKKDMIVINPGETGGWLSDKGTVVLLDIDELSWVFIEL
ncbi:MAG: metallophosphoesterase [Candidatus Aminicenantia bacterium]